jgi:hypothetical protein
MLQELRSGNETKKDERDDSCNMHGRDHRYRQFYSENLKKLYHLIDLEDNIKVYLKYSVIVWTAFNLIDKVYGTYGAGEKTYMFWVVKPGGESLIGVSRCRWENNIINYL